MEASSRRPNILFILADDMGYGDFGCFNDGRSQTPTLDQLVAAEGVCLTQHYSASPVCAPARASLLTGRYPHRTGAIDTLELRGLDRMALRERTIADLLRARRATRPAWSASGTTARSTARYHPNRARLRRVRRLLRRLAPLLRLDASTATARRAPRATGAT